MSDHTPGNGAAISDQAAVAALTKMFVDANKKLIGQTDAQQTALMALTAIVVALPGTKDLDQEKLAGVLFALSGGKHAEHADQLKKVAAYMQMVVNMAKKLPEAEAAALAELAAQPAKDKAPKKPN